MAATTTASRSIASMRLVGVRTGAPGAPDNSGHKNFVYAADGRTLVQASPSQPLPWRIAAGDGDVLARVQSVFSTSFRVLFVIERDMNSNVVVYGLPAAGDGSSAVPPTRVFWLMAAAAGGAPHTEELTLLERRYAYGIDPVLTQCSLPAKEVLRVKALGDDDLITVQRHADDGEYYAMLRLYNRDVILRRIYICTEPGMLFGHTTTELHLEVVESPRATSSTTYYFKL